MKRRHTILCVDSDGFGLQVRRLVLETVGHRVVAFTRIDEALASLGSTQADAVMLDHNLEAHQPGTARRFRELQPTTPILMLSNELYPPASARPFIDTFITKGEVPEHLLAEIEHVLNKHGHQQHRLRPILWASGAVATGAAWFAARTLRRRFHKHDIAQIKKPPIAEKPKLASKSARA